MPLHPSKVNKQSTGEEGSRFIFGMLRRTAEESERKSAKSQMVGKDGHAHQ
jgi:hypothetical protein